jgi:hypothetical protein
MFEIPPSTRRMIRRHAGTIPPEDLANAIGWPLSVLERVTAAWDISLAPLAIEIVEDPPENTPPDRACRAVISVRLRDADDKELARRGRAKQIKRATLGRLIIEGAIARGLVDELVTAALASPVAASLGDKSDSVSD